MKRLSKIKRFCMDMSGHYLVECDKWAALKVLALGGLDLGIAMHKAIWTQPWWAISETHISTIIHKGTSANVGRSYMSCRLPHSSTNFAYFVCGGAGYRFTFLMTIVKNQRSLGYDMLWYRTMIQEICLYRLYIVFLYTYCNYITFNQGISRRTTRCFFAISDDWCPSAHCSQAAGHDHWLPSKTPLPTREEHRCAIHQRQWHPWSPGNICQHSVSVKICQAMGGGSWIPRFTVKATTADPPPAPWHCLRTHEGCCGTGYLLKSGKLNFICCTGFRTTVIVELYVHTHTHHSII